MGPGDRALTGEDPMSYGDRDWADDYGYQHIHCSRCGWSGWSDTGCCEGRCADEEDEDRAKRCPECDEYMDDCECERCAECGELRDDCECERCAECGELRDDCECEMFSVRSFCKVTRHTARRDHKDGKVKAGDRYDQTVDAGYFEGGPRWMNCYKYVLKRASQAGAQ
jgi:hypothetical protein